ncbi:MAG: hypothetical protein PHX78_03160 [bacterium]|nr:hypothetical protein [bacterium]
MEDHLVVDFLNDLRLEIRETKKERADFIRQKFTYVIGLLGIGSISIGSFKPLILLYLAPIIAFTFDLYIVGASFKIKRAGGFLCREDSKSSSEEKKWEEWVRQNRDPFPQLAGLLVSIMVLFVSMIVLWLEDKNNLFYWAWIIINLLILIGVWTYSYILNEAIHKFEIKKIIILFISIFKSRGK